MVEDAKKQKDVERAKKEEPKSEKKEIKSQQPAKEVEDKKGKVLSSEEEKRSEEKETKKVQLTSKAEDIIKTVESMSVLELSNLVKALEEKFGISAQAPVVAPVGTQVVSETTKPQEEEKSSFDIILQEVGPKKIQVIKEIRAVTTLGLKEAKDLVEQAPKPIKEGISKQEAEEIRKKLEQVGAKVELK